MLTEFQRARLSIAIQIVAFAVVFGGLAIGGFALFAAEMAISLAWVAEAKASIPWVDVLASGLRACGFAIAGLSCAIGFGLRVLRLATLSIVSGSET